MWVDGYWKGPLKDGYPDPKYDPKQGGTPLPYPIERNEYNERT